MNETFLFRFTPSLMKPEALEGIFVQREEMALRTVEQIRESALTPSKHHSLLIGPRGIGKTHFVSLIYHRVKAMDDLRDRLLIAWLREEEWGITSFLDLVIRIFRALVAEYEDAELEKRVESLYELPVDEIARAAGRLLKEYAGDRAMLILIENLDDVFQGFVTEEQQRLRAYIQENPFFTILATAQSLFNGVSLQTSPFYGFFRIQHLKGLDIEEATQLLTNIARYKGDQDLASFIQTPMGRARIRAVNHLAGGNHRVYVIFSQFLTRESLDELVEPFMRMLDDLTPYYQDRMRWLSQQQRKIVEFLLNRRSPATVKEIAQRCFMTHQTASGQLKSLREMDYVYSTSQGRESYYELREPLMRLCVEVKKSRGEPIRLFVDFLRFWYLMDELKQRLELLYPEAALEREYVLHALKAIEEDPEDPRVAACYKDLNIYFEAKDFLSALKVADELVAIKGDSSEWFVQGVCLGGLERYEEALTSFDKVIEIEPDNALALANRGAVLSQLGHYEKAVASLDRSLEIDPEAVLIWSFRGAVLIQLKRYEEVLSSCNKAIELGAQFPRIFFDRAEALLALGRWDEGGAAIMDIIVQFGQAAESNKDGIIETLEIIICNHIRILFNSTRDPEIWRARITSLIEIDDKNRGISILRLGLVYSISALTEPTVSDATARMWRDVWQEVAGDRAEFQLPLRLLDVAVRYRENKDRRVLLELPIEERKIIEQLLGSEEEQND